MSLPPAQQRIAEIIQDKSTPNLITIANHQGIDSLCAAVKLLVMKTAQGVMLTSPMTTEMVNIAAEIIIEKYYYLKLDELSVAFKNGLSGNYGTIYNRLDVTVLCDWLNKYDQERMKVSERLRRQESETNNIYEVFQSDIMRDALRTVVEKLPKVADKPEPVRSKPSEFEQMVMAEWDEIEYEKGTRLKHCFEVLMDFDDYRKWRLSEELDKLQAEENETP